MSSLLHWFRSLQFSWIRLRYYLNGYVKMRYDFQVDEQENGFPSETHWSKPLGDNLYQLENIPEFIEESNLHDVVKCQKKPNELPVVVEIVHRSGNRTLRVEFREETSPENPVNVVWDLREKQVFYEKAGARRYMFNIEPSINYETFRNFLNSKEEEGLLWPYE